MSLVSTVHAAIAKVAPIHGVSIGSSGDKRTWRIDFKETATAAERAAALSLMAGFDVGTLATNEALLGEIDALEAGQTLRRIREAVLAIDGGWLSTLNQQIAAIRLRLR